ncbi:Serine/threonine-protein kinase Nek1 [Bulinus truncatus]|nr:Serine/threonine-protein kinase Nek1 [Bulinus truncatus]
MQYALKVVQLKATSSEEAQREGNTMMRLRHPHLVQCCSASYVEGNLFCLLLEFCGRGTLTKEIQRIVIGEKRAINWLAQMADAIKYLHQEHLMHRDIKPDNILLNEDDNIKVSDLGLAMEQEYTYQSAGTQAGTPCYMSPQALEGKRYTNKADVWSLGCVFHQVFSRAPPFRFPNIRPILTGQIPPLPLNTNFNIRNLISEMLGVDEEERPSAGQLFNTIKQILLPVVYQRARYNHMNEITLDALSVRKAVESFTGLSLSAENQQGWGCC